MKQAGLNPPTNFILFQYYLKRLDSNRQDYESMASSSL